MRNSLPGAIALVALAGLASAADARMPTLNHTCPIGIGMFTDAEGRVYIDAQEAVVKEIGKDRYTATIPGVVISITANADGSARVSYTAKGASGACRQIPPPSEDNG